MPIISREYEKFLREEQLAKKLTFYERSCRLSEKILPLSPPFKGLKEKYKESIEFSHLKITPKGAFSLSLITTLLIFIVSLIALVILNSFTSSSLILSSILSLITFYFFVVYPNHHATVFRINASSEMVLATIYMSISMHISPNLENAIKFASNNLKGSLSVDLRELLWDVYTRKYDKIEDALDSFIVKWKKDNKEFAESLYLIKNSGAESQEKRERFLDEAVSVMLDGTKERMRLYSRQLKEPVTILNALGILLPIIGLVFFPIISLFLPELIQPIFLVVGYDFFLPLIVFLFMNSYLEKRPYSLHQPDLSKHPDFSTVKFYEKPYTIPLLVSLPLIAIGLVNIIGKKDLFSFGLLVYSMLITLGLFIGIATYSALSVKRKLKIRKEIASIESEFAETLFQLGSMILRGTPLETALRRVKEDIKNLKIAQFFDKILYNIETFGLTFENAVFDKTYGAINYYPSNIVESAMHVIVETSKKGMQSASKSMIIISKYLKDMHEVEEDLKNMLEEVTSTMNIQSILLAPLSAGVVVTIAVIMTRLLVNLGETLTSVYSEVGSALGPAGDIGTGVISSIVNLSAIIPIHGFQLIVGVYIVEIVTIIAITLSTITNGDEGLMKRLTISKHLTYSCIVYFITLLSTYFLFTSVISIEKLII
ncbi:MAG: hypothetical protein HYS80_01005 [Candidatus Aenigmarchaeota archaeon]|nr:hypothetical protein [Candidatus Aenigmarchaeota archaeon]